MTLRATVCGVIVSFRHKGLEALFRSGSKKGIQVQHVPKLRRILTVLDSTRGPEDLTHPAYRTHPLTGQRAGQWSMCVTGNWRVTFRFTDSNDVELVDYEDYH